MKELTEGQKKAGRYIASMMSQHLIGIYYNNGEMILAGSSYSMDSADRNINMTIGKKFFRRLSLLLEMDFEPEEFEFDIPAGISAREERYFIGIALSCEMREMLKPLIIYGIRERAAEEVKFIESL
jgi:hypothetical protein